MTKYKKIALLTILSLFLIISIPNSYADVLIGSTSYSTISDALIAASPGDTIILDPGTYHEANMIIDKDITIIVSSPTVTIDAGLGGNIFDITSGCNVYITGITFTGGNSILGGAINNEGTLTLNDCTFTGNEAIGSGGAISNGRGTLTLTDCNFNNNKAGGYGGAICNNGPLTLIDCTFTGNTATDGGAIYNDNDGTVTLTGSTFSNPADTFGFVSFVSASGKGGEDSVEITVNNLGTYHVIITNGAEILLDKDIIFDQFTKNVDLSHMSLVDGSNYGIEFSKPADALKLTIGKGTFIASSPNNPVNLPNNPVNLPNNPVNLPNNPVNLPNNPVTLTTSDETTTPTTPNKPVNPTTPTKEEKLGNSYVEDDDVENSVGAANIVTMKSTGIPIIAIILIVLSLLGVGIFRKR